VYSIVVNSTEGYKLGNTLVGLVANYLWACNSVSIILWPILHLWNAKLGNNTGIISNFERIIGSFWGNKRIVIGDVLSIFYQGLMTDRLKARIKFT